VEGGGLRVFHVLVYMPQALQALTPLSDSVGDMQCAQAVLGGRRPSGLGVEREEGAWVLGVGSWSDPNAWVKCHARRRKGEAGKTGGSTIRCTQSSTSFW